MFILQVPPTSLIHKMSTKTTAGQTLYRTLSLHIYVEETFIWTEIWKNQEALLTFLRGQDARYGSSECRPALN